MDNYVRPFLMCYSEWHIPQTKFLEVRMTQLYIAYIDYCDDILLDKEDFCKEVFSILKIPNYCPEKSCRRAIKIYGNLHI